MGYIVNKFEQLMAWGTWAGEGGSQVNKFEHVQVKRQSDRMNNRQIRLKTSPYWMVKIETPLRSTQDMTSPYQMTGERNDTCMKDGMQASNL